MKRLFTTIAFLSVFGYIQAQLKQETPVKEDKNSLLTIPFNPDAQVITEHITTIKGQKIPFVATTGTMPVWDEEGKAIAGLFYTFYERSDVKDKANRPLVISFNGGPGSASVWMHIAYTGPHLLNIDD